MVQAYLCVESKASLRTEPALGVDQPVTLLDTPGVVYKWDSESLATDDDNLVLKPNALLSTDKGRYVFIYKWNIKKEEVFTGTTDSSGNYTVTFSQPYAAVPFIVPIIPNQTDKNQNIIISNVTANGFTVNAYTRPVVTSLPIIGNLLGSIAVGLLGASNTPSASLAVRVKVSEV